MGEVTTTYVAGLGRCGLSLTMQMLDAGGMPVFGQYPAYEDMSPFQDDVEKIIYQNSTKAIKVVDPIHWKFPQIDCRSIVLTRNPTEQAKSSFKLLRVMSGVPTPTRGEIRKMASSIRADTGLMMRRMKRLCCGDIIHITFEELLGEPEATIGKLSSFLDMKLDAPAMISQIVPRFTNCTNRMIELELLREVEGV